MSHETTFRVTFIIIFALIMSISIYHRHRARQQGGKIPRSTEGKLFLLLRALFGLPLFLSVFAYMINPDWMTWAALPLPTWLRWCGVGIGLLTIPLEYWVFKSLGKNVSETVLTKEHHTLVTHGPYRWVRHPLYTVACAGFMALSLIAANGFMALMILLIALTLPALTRKEEALLIDKFGDAYRDYLKTTGRYLPRSVFFPSLQGEKPPFFPPLKGGTRGGSNSRREFLKTLSATLITAASSSIIFESCAGGAATYRAKLIDKAIAIPKTEVEHLKATNGYLTVRESSLPGAIILRFVDNEGLVALSDICTHRGCEVQPLPNAFECPCHGSEYDVCGNVLEGPARLPLKRYDVEEAPEVWIIKIS